ncbi:LANO_0B03818g1_1 [Lachancea nothofagi CBS 11611]|uniref:Kinetochore-associated protein n=1 Tax=Lachancea nothofagi CBS 11611 TaxID=1266666 RepID=A0A1G4IX74_9SACH|nr:LANO_0B03818g1_1 [Lachancea nothofagi CBS 11611]
MPEGVRIRYKRLNQVCRKALQQSVNKIQNWEKLSSCFPQYTATDAGAKNLSTCQRQVIEFWMELSKREFEEIFKERDIENKLNDLDDLISHSKDVQKTLNQDHPAMACIDELSPEQLINGNMHDSRVSLLGQLDDRLGTVADMNKALELELEHLRSQISSETKELNEIYDRSMGQESDSMDEVLQQGLRDMLVELREEEIE